MPYSHITIEISGTKESILKFYEELKVYCNKKISPDIDYIEPDMEYLQND